MTNKRKRIEIKVPRQNISSTVELPKSIEKKLDEWVINNSSQTEEHNHPAPPTTVKEKQPSYRLSVDIESSLFTKFKQLCVAEEVSIKKKITDLMMREMNKQH